MRSSSLITHHRSPFTLLSAHSKVTRLHFFHQCNGNARAAAIYRSPFQLDACHGTYRRRHPVQSPFRFWLPLDAFASPWAEHDVIGDYPFSSHPHILLDFTSHEWGEIRRHTIQPMIGVIGPHHPVDKPTGLTGRDVDPDSQSTASTFRSYEPLGSSIPIRPFFNSFGMHPATATTGQHGKTP